MNSLSNRAYFAALLSVFIWGAFPTLVKSALAQSSIEQLLTIRFLVSTLFLIAILPRTIVKIRQLPFKMLIGFTFVTILVFYSQTYALNNVPASWYVAAFTFVPIIFLLFYREPLNTIGKIGAMFAVLGMILFFSSLSQAETMTVGNVILLIISMLAWVAYSIMAKQLQILFKDNEFVALTCLIGLLSSLFFWSMTGFKGDHISFFGFFLCVLAGIALLIALLAYSFSLRIKPMFAMFSQYLEPIFGLIIAAIFMGEKLCFFQYLAASVIILGTFLVGFATQPRLPEVLSTKPPVAS
jgi:drug/metabolite transporter (DMT)-like permease